MFVIFIFLLVFAALFKSNFFIPALAAFFGAFVAFMFNYLMKIMRDYNMEKATLYECKFKIEKINKFIQESMKAYQNTNKGMVFTGHAIPEIIESDIMFLLKNGEKGEDLLNKILFAKAGYEEVCARIKVRNEIIVKGAKSDIEEQILRSTTETLDVEFARLPNEINICASLIENYIKDLFL